MYLLYARKAVGSVHSRELVSHICIIARVFKGGGERERVLLCL